MAGDIKKDAKITVGVEGAEDVGAAANKAFAPWEQAGARVGNTIKSVGNTIAGLAQTAISDMTRIASAAAGVNAAQGVASFRALEDQIARLGAASGSGLGQVREQIGAAARQAQLGETAVAAWAKGVGRLTYDYRQGAQQISAFNAEALATGRSAEEMAPLAVALHNTLGLAGDASDELGRMRAMADALGTTGGPAALADRLVAVSGILDTLGHKTAEQRHNIEAMVAGLGKGLSADGQTRVTSRILGDIAKDPRGYERMLGLKKGELVDEQGHIKDPMRVLELTQAHLLKRGGGNREHARMIAANMLGGDYEAGSALLNADVGAMRAAANLGPSGAAATAAAAYQASEAGKVAEAGNERERRQRALGGAISPYVLGIEQTAAAHPLLTMGALSAGGGLLSAGVGGGIRGGAGLLASLFGGVGGKVGAGAASALTGSNAAPVFVTNWPPGFGSGGIPGVGAGGVASGVGSLLTGGAGAVLGAAAAPAAVALGFGAAWVDEAANLAHKRPQIEAETAAKLERQRTNRAQHILSAALESGGTEEGFKKALGPSLMAQIGHDPALQSVASGIASGGIDLADLPAAMREAVEAGIKGTKLESVVNITNSSDVDVDVEVKGQKAKAAGGRN